MQKGVNRNYYPTQKSTVSEMGNSQPKGIKLKMREHKEVV